MYNRLYLHIYLGEDILLFFIFSCRFELPSGVISFQHKWLWLAGKAPFQLWLPDMFLFCLQFWKILSLAVWPCFICLFCFHWHECATSLPFSPPLFLRGHHPLALFALHPNIKEILLLVFGYELQLVKMQTVSDYGEPHPSWYIS